MQNKSKELEIAIQTALEAGKILEKYFETEITRDVKDDTSIVTIADHESEAVIKKLLSKNFPEHCILGEETGKNEKESCYTWHVDPVDGTRNFANGIPLFAVSIALEKDGELLVGVVYNPSTNSLFYAEKDKGAFWNEKRIVVSKDDAGKAIVTVSSGRDKVDLKLRRNLLHDLPDLKFSVRDFGCTALDLAYVAKGNTEADIKCGLKTYDFAAGVLLVQEAGGKITKLDGSEWKFPENKFIASNGVFHDTLVEEIKKQKANIKL